MKKIVCLILALAFVAFAVAPVVSASPSVSIKGKHVSVPQVVFEVSNPPTVVGLAGGMPVISLGTVAVEEAAKAAETLPKTASAFRG